MRFSYLLPVCVFGHARIRIDDSKQFVDSDGLSYVFHGHNIVVKRAPYLPTNDGFDAIMSLTEEDILLLREWGTNIVRLGVIWEAVER